MDSNILALLKIKGFGNVKVKSLSEFIDNNKKYNAKELHNLISEFSEKVKKTNIPSIVELEIALDESNKIIETCFNKNIKIISYNSSNYPDRLKSINNSPVILFLKGNYELLNNEDLVSVIGTRKPTDDAIKLGKNLTKTLTDNNFKIVSGLALGCDTIAHKVCLENDLETIAVLPSSVDEIYPVENRKLGDEILNKNGLIISEYEPGSIVTKNKYIERNRIVSGISKGICVIQCDIKSGTMRTVEIAHKQNKKIGVINFSFSKNTSEYEGNNLLLSKSKYLSLGSRKDIDEFVKSIKNKKYKNKESGQIKLF